MKVFLANAPWSKPGYYGIRAGSRWPHFEKLPRYYMPFPFFLAYAAAILENNKFEVILIDAIAERISIEEFYSRICDLNPDLIVFEVSTPSIKTDLEIAKRSKALLNHTAKVAFCGIHSYMYENEFLGQYNFIDYILIGEYEYTLLELAAHLKDDKNLDGVLGLIYRDNKNKVIVNSRRPLITNLDDLPYPARHFLPMHNYCDTPGGIPTPSVQMWASRGCPFNCVFCAWPQIMYGNNSYRVRNPKAIVDELECLIEKYKFRSVYFDDDTFNIGKNRMLEFCQVMKERNLNIPWAIMARVDMMDREILEAMKNSGLVALKYGIESGSQYIVNNCSKSLNLEKAKENIKITKELGIKYHLTFCFGLPGETQETIKETMRFVKETTPDSAQFSIATPFPGSKYFKILESSNNLLSKDFGNYDGYNCAVIRTDALSPGDIINAVKKAERLSNYLFITNQIKTNLAGMLSELLLHPLRFLGRLTKIWR